VVGDAVGAFVGGLVGSSLGEPVGDLVGLPTGELVGAVAMGDLVGAVAMGDLLGRAMGDLLGRSNVVPSFTELVVDDAGAMAGVVLLRHEEHVEVVKHTEAAAAAAAAKIRRMAKPPSRRQRPLLSFRWFFLVFSFPSSEVDPPNKGPPNNAAVASVPVDDSVRVRATDWNSIPSKSTSS
jgi:hypothetical protein